MHTSIARTFCAHSYIYNPHLCFVCSSLKQQKFYFEQLVQDFSFFLARKCVILSHIFFFFFFCVTEEDSVKDRTEQDQPQENNIDDTGKNDVPFTDSLSSESSDDVGNSLMQMRREDGKMRTLSGRVFNCQGKNLRINIPLTTPTRTFSALSYLVWEDLMTPSSKKCGPEGRKLQVNRSKLHHAGKMIRGAYVELYKGLGYLKTYRYNTLIKLYVQKY